MGEQQKKGELHSSRMARRAFRSCRSTGKKNTIGTHGTLLRLGKHGYSVTLQTPNLCADQ